MATPPIPPQRLKQIAQDACQSAIGSAEYYDHSKVEQWNSAIISNVLKAVISESGTEDKSRPGYKFACNSTIVQHIVPTSQLNKGKGAEAKAEEAKVSTSADSGSTDSKPQVGRRGLHSATGAYWDEKRDGMWSFKYEGGEGLGMDVVIMLLWVAY